jgi:hypothetical protein
MLPAYPGMSLAGRPGLRISPAAGQPPGVGQRTAQEKLDLGVGAAQLAGGPPGQDVMDSGVEPQQDALALAHAVTGPAPSSPPPPLDVADTTYLS